MLGLLPRARRRRRRGAPAVRRRHAAARRDPAQRAAAAHLPRVRRRRPGAVRPARDRPGGQRRHRRLPRHAARRCTTSSAGSPSDFAVAFNDLDYCLRVRRSGRRIIWTPHATLYHFESQTPPARCRPARDRPAVRALGPRAAPRPVRQPELRPACRPCGCRPNGRPSPRHSANAWRPSVAGVGGDPDSPPSVVWPGADPRQPRRLCKRCDRRSPPGPHDPRSCRVKPASSTATRRIDPARTPVAADGGRL